jgi:N-acetylglucosamine-6-phosphate deacetylase
VGETGGAWLEGIFLEGPFISPAKKGAWTAEHLRAPVVEDLHRLLDASGGTLRRVNVAPELPGALEFIREAREQDIVVSIGHSNATYDEAVAGIEAGATIANHTYNAMSGLDHRSPGMAGAILARDDLLAELILDGVHVHPAAAAALYRARGATGVALITDSSMMAGRPDGTYQAGHRTLTIKDNSCRLPDGTLAGSVARFDQCVRNAAKFLGLDLMSLAAISSANAANAMGIASETGSITTGRYANLVLLNDQLEPQATVVRGKVVFERQEVRR